MVPDTVKAGCMACLHEKSCVHSPGSNESGMNNNDTFCHQRSGDIHETPRPTPRQNSSARRPFRNLEMESDRSPIHGGKAHLYSG